MLLQLEIFIFLISFGYLLYYVGDRIFGYFKKKSLQKVERQKRREERIQARQQQEIEKTEEETEKSGEEKHEEKSYISPAQSAQLSEITKRAQLNLSRGYFESARSLIVEGLAIKKLDRTLNLLLGEVYFREKKYEKAAYVYEDVLAEHPHDFEVLEKLGQIHSLLDNFEKSFDFYEQAFELDKEALGVIDILSHLALELGNYEKSLKYANVYLKHKPRDADNLGVKGYALEKLGKANQAILAYTKVLEIQPYNTEVKDRIEYLQSKKQAQEGDKESEISQV